eukprot:CFRG7001T1
MQGLKNLFQSAAQSAATVLAPPIVDDFDEFYSAWRSITNYYSDTTLNAAAVQNTLIPEKMNILLEKLAQERYRVSMSEWSRNVNEEDKATDMSASTSNSSSSVNTENRTVDVSVRNSNRLPSTLPNGYPTKLGRVSSGTGGAMPGTTASDMPCLDHMLQHAFETLCQLGHGNMPIGMKEEVLSFLTKFLAQTSMKRTNNIEDGRMSSNNSSNSSNHSRTPIVALSSSMILSHPKVARPLKRLLKACHAPKSSPYEEQVVSILEVIARLLRGNPTCAEYFFDPIPDSEKDRFTLESLGYGDGQEEFFILDALTDLLSSEDSHVVNKACAATLYIVNCESDKIANYVASNGRFAQILMKRLAVTFKALPSERGPTEQDRKLLMRALDSFRAWASYVDDVFCKCKVNLHPHLSYAMTTHFLTPCLAKELRETNEVKVFATTRYLSFWLHFIKSDNAFDCVASFLVGSDTTTPEVRSSNHSDNYEIVPLRRVLIDRCESLSPKLTSATIQIFDLLLLRFTPHAYENLILRNFPDGTFAHSNCTDIVAAWDKVEAWTQLVPDELKAKTSEGEEDDYHNYYVEAQKHAAHAVTAKSKWNCGDNGLSQDIVEFYEGDFLKMLLFKIQRMIEESYSEILGVSALITRLATFPCDPLRSFLLDPKCDVPNTSVTLYQSLQIVVTELSRRAGAIDNFQDLVTRAKFVLSERGQIREDDEPELWEHAKELQGVILLDEFVKEIASCCMVGTESSM